MKKSAFIILALLISKSTLLYSQTFDLSGTILDENEKPISFANLSLQEISISSICDNKGRYSFSSLPEGTYHLHVSHTGYQNKTLIVMINNEESSLNIILEKSLIETQTIDVTSSFNPTSISNSTFSVTSIETRTLSRIRNGNISSTIQNIPGINNLSTGGSIGKPVIRGLTYQCVLIVHDGVKHESQLWGDEHGPEISLFDIDRIEILRGPASLKYGADGIGGVVNIITKPLQFSGNNKIISYGNIDLNGFSVNNEGVGNLLFGLGTKNFGLKGYSGYRRSNDINTPDGQLTINTPDGQKTIQGGKLFNSGDEEFQAGVTMGLKGKFGNLSASYENFTRKLQLHDDPEEDPTATPNQKILTNHFELKTNIRFNKQFQLEPIVSYEQQSRKEFESIQALEEDKQALNLNLKVFQGDLRLHHNISGNIAGTFGGSVIINSNRSLAEEKLIPNYNGNSFGIYLLEKYEKKYFTVSGGIRFDSKNLNIKETVFEMDENGDPLKVIDPRILNFNSVTGSLGMVYKPDTDIDVYANIGRGWRPPSEFELFVDGVHEGTNRFDKGLITLDSNYKANPEESFNIDVGTRIRGKFFNGEFSFFRNLVNHFIYPSPTGDVDSSSGLQIFDIKQDQSSFIGFEYNMQFQPASWMLLTVKGDYVNTKNKETNDPLPFTPPSKNLLELKIQKESIGKFYNAYLILGSKIVSAAIRVDPLEAVTDGYTLFNAGFGFDYIISRSVASVDFSISNLTDKKYVDHLSRYRYYAMNPGRSYNLNITVPFQF
ncbi:MAG: TonB-dependent receptor [Ignavibacteria bacterium]